MIRLTAEQAQKIEEAMESVHGLSGINMSKPLATIRAARAQEQAEQDPVAWYLDTFDEDGELDYREYNSSNKFSCGLGNGTPLYAAPQPVSQEYQDHLVNQSFDWAAMAAKHQFMEGYRIGLAEMREKCAELCESYNWSSNGCAAAIRAIKFEGDTGFRPVSEMIAEHKQDSKKAAAIEKAKMRKAEQEPVAWMFWNNYRYEASEDKSLCEQYNVDNKPLLPLYAAPVRTKDLTDDEIRDIWNSSDTYDVFCVEFARAVIAKFKEKNK